MASFVNVGPYVKTACVRGIRRVLYIHGDTLSDVLNAHNLFLVQPGADNQHHKGRESIQPTLSGNFPFNSGN